MSYIAMPIAPCDDGEMRWWCLALGLTACGFRGAELLQGDAPQNNGIDAPTQPGIDATTGIDAPLGIDAAVGIDAAPAIDAATGVDAWIGPWLPGYLHRKPIAITTGVPSTLLDFPVAITTIADPQLASGALPNGGDLVVTASDGTTVLASEVVAYANGTLELWTRVPALAPSTSLYLYYGGPATSPNPTLVWSSLFVGVWHLSDPGNGARDSTSHAHDLSTIAANEPGHSGGIAGAARTFDGAKQTLGIPDPSDGSLQFTTNSFSYSIWVKEQSASMQYDLAFWKGGTSAGEHGYCIMLGQNSWDAKVHDGTNFNDAVFGQEAALTGRWVHLVAVVDHAANKLEPYTDGVLQVAGLDNLTGLGTLASTKPLALGGVAGSSFFHGSIDEVRIYNSVLSADWIRAEHGNLATPGFVVLGPEQ